jgi:hypothetical protein
VSSVPNSVENDADTYEDQPDVEEYTDSESQLRDAAYVLKLTTVFIFMLYVLYYSKFIV